MKIEMYTGAACSGYSHSGGCAAILVNARNGEEITSVANGYRHTTEERMDIMAIISGLRVAKSLKNVEEIKVHTPYWKIERHHIYGYSREPSTVDLWEELFTEISKLEKKGINIVLKRAFDTWYAHDPLFLKVFKLARDINKAKDKHGIDSVFDARYKAEKAEAKKGMPKVKAKKVEIYTTGELDDAFATKGRGGCAAILVDAQSGEEIARVFKGYRHTEGHRMEIKAIIWGILYAKNLKAVEEIKIFPQLCPMNSHIFKYGHINTILQPTSDNVHYWFNDEPLDGLSALFCELKKKGIRISIVQLVDDDKWTCFGTRRQQINYKNVLEFCCEERDRSDDLIDSAFEAETGYRVPKDIKKEQVERLKLRIREILSIVMNRDADIYDLAARHALSGFALNTFGISCDLSDIPDRLSKRIIEADADTKRAFINLLEHLCCGEHGALEDTGIRVCSTCGELMVDGYHLGGDDTCSWPCTVKNFMEAARDRGEEANTYYNVAEINLQIKLNKTKRDREKPIYMNWGLIEKGK